MTAPAKICIASSGPLFRTGRSSDSQWLIYALNLFTVGDANIDSLTALRKMLAEAESGLIVHEFDLNGSHRQCTLDTSVKLASPRDIPKVEICIDEFEESIQGYQSEKILVQPFSICKSDREYSLKPEGLEQYRLEPGGFTIGEDGTAWSEIVTRTHEGPF